MSNDLQPDSELLADFVADGPDLWLGEALLAALAIVLPCLCLRRWSGGRIAVTCWAVLLWIVTWKAWVEGWGSDALAISTLAAVVSLTRLNVAPPTAEATK